MLTPKFEARILQEANVKKHEHVLEIGAGSGYMAALLAHRARHVTTAEIKPELKALAEKNLADYGVINVDVALGNGAQGWEGGATKNAVGNSNGAPYDVIVISGSLPMLTKTNQKQNKNSSRILAVIGEAPVMS